VTTPTRAKPSTSTEAYRSTDTAGHRQRVLSVIRDAGAYGATDDEVEAATGMLHQTASASRRSLVLSGDVVASGTTRPTRTGRAAQVWIVSDHGNATQAPHNLQGVQGEAEEPQEYPVGEAWALARQALDLLTGDQHRLVWRLDLFADLGPADLPGDPNGYEDLRMVSLLDRLGERLRTDHAWGEGEWLGDTVDSLAMMVRCVVDGKQQWVGVTVDIPHRLRVETLAQRRPPVGSWALVSQREWLSLKTTLPWGFFRDGIPF
jgi:hypothetical protein